MKVKIIRIAMVCTIVPILLFGCTSVTVKESLLEGDTGVVVFQSVTIDDKAFFGGRGGGTPTKISGQLHLPAKKGKLPAVIITHGSGGVQENERGWAKELNRMGFASFILDSYTHRGIKHTYSGKQSLGTGSSIIDTYRALKLLRTHPRVDPSRIALMGFSRGGRVTLNASMLRFQKKWLPPDINFTAYIAFYPAIIAELIGQEDVSGQPIRIFQGVADDWTIVEKARMYIDQIRKNGGDAQIIEYPDAHHLFDNPKRPVKFVPNALNISKCNFRETTLGGEWMNPDTNEKWNLKASCIKRGVTVGYNADAHRRSIKDVNTFLKTVFQQ